MKRFLIASAVVTLLALPPVLQATGTAATNPYVARYSLDYYRNDPVPLTALEIRRIEKAAALYGRTGTITILPARVMPKAPAPVVSAAPASANCVPAGSAPVAAAYVAPAPAAIIGPTDLELRRQAKADLLFKRTGIRTVLPARNVAPVAAPVVAPSSQPRAYLAPKCRFWPRCRPTRAARSRSRSSRGRCSGRRKCRRPTTRCLSPARWACLASGCSASASPAGSSPRSLAELPSHEHAVCPKPPLAEAGGVFASEPNETPSRQTATVFAGVRRLRAYSASRKGRVFLKKCRMAWGYAA